MNKLTQIIAPITLLMTAGCSTTPSPFTPPTAQGVDQLPTNTLILPTDNNAPLYYSVEEITQLTGCAAQAKQAGTIAQEKLAGKTAQQIKEAHANDVNPADNQTLIDQAFASTFFSKNDFAMKIFHACATTNHLTAERTERAAFCMSNQFFIDYVWTAKQQGLSEREVRTRLADSANKAIPLIVREVYNHDSESVDEARTRLWDGCIHNFKQLK